MSKKKQVPTIRSGAAEYLTFVAATGQSGVNVIYADENVWLSQKMMAMLYDVDVRTINEHLGKIFSDNELAEDSVIRKFRITAADGKSYDTKHYCLEAIIAVGYKVNSERAVQFRKWATHILKDFAIQGWAMDDERLKNGGSVLTRDYFDRQLQRIREIRMSERRFYQKITDIYVTALDYDKTAKTTQRFFATVQNKLHWAIHGHTAAELIAERKVATQFRKDLKKDGFDMMRFSVYIRHCASGESVLVHIERVRNCLPLSKSIKSRLARDLALKASFSCPTLT